MARTQRQLRRIRRQLPTGELLMGSAEAVEDEGRRRQVVVVTDRRVLVTGSRGDHSVEFPLEGSTCEYQRCGARLTLRHGELQLTVREVDELASRTIQTLLGAREARRSAQHAVRGCRGPVDGL